MTEVKPFGELSREEKLELLTAWVDGKTIEFFSRVKEQWEKIAAPSWVENSQYRIALTPDSIDWSHVSPDLKYIARDLNGEVWIYNHKPKLDRSSNRWLSDADIIASNYGRKILWDERHGCVFSSYVRGTVYWKDSLVERPRT